MSNKTKKSLGPVSINSYVMVAKMIVASAIDGNGNQLHPRDWNNKFIGLPKLEKKKQRRPSFSSEIVTGLARYGVAFYRVLFILLAATGARIGEILGLEIDKHFSADFRTILIRQKVRQGKVEHYVKTDASSRDIDLHPAVSDMLKCFVGDRKSGLLFCDDKGKPLYSSDVATTHLCPALKILGYENNYDKSQKAGFHAFRRFRNTWLRNFTSCPQGLRQFWIGHEGKEIDGGMENKGDMGDRYDMIRILS